MKLADYLVKKKLTYAAFADLIDVANAKVVERYAKGTRMPRPHIMLRIVAATGRRVRPEDFYEVAS